MKILKYVLCERNEDSITVRGDRGGGGNFGDTTHGGADNGRDSNSGTINRNDKTNDTEFASIYADLETYEAKIPYMYVDTNGHVTVGIGTMLPSVADAQRLAFNKPSGVRATAAEIKAEFERVQRAFAKNKAATAYHSPTSLTLTEDTIKELVRTHVDADRISLHNRYSDFYDFNLGIQVALHDMIYQLGSAGLGKYTTFNKAVNDKNWTKAADESNRKDANKARNDATKKAFTDAQAVKDAAEWQRDRAARRSER